MTLKPLVRDLMTPSVATCRPNTPIPQVARQMRNMDVSALIVVDDHGKMLGLVSRTDLVTLRAHDEYWQGLHAEHVMVKNIVCVTPDTPLHEALEVLLARKIHRVVVVDDCNALTKPLGILSITDIVRDMAE